jgi:hypothetical protein
MVSTDAEGSFRDACSSSESRSSNALGNVDKKNLTTYHSLFSKEVHSGRKGTRIVFTVSIRPQHLMPLCLDHCWKHIVPPAIKFFSPINSAATIWNQ